MGIFAAQFDLLGRRECRRCHKMFSPKKQGMEYGPKCARRIAGIVAALERYGNVVDPQLKKPAEEKSAEESAVAAYRGAVLA